MTTSSTVLLQPVGIVVASLRLPALASQRCMGGFGHPCNQMVDARRRACNWHIRIARPAQRTREEGSKRWKPGSPAKAESTYN